MYHYVYLLEFPDGMQYVGAKSRSFHPDLDECYLGSGRYLPIDRTRHNCIKKVIGIYPTRAAAITAEIAYIKQYDCVKSPKYYNVRIRTFDKYGISSKQCEGTKHSGDLQRNRSKHTHAYLKEKGIKFKQYTGVNRTKALKDADIRRGNKIRGTKNKSKGHVGVTNTAFTPWYYVSSDGVYHEMYSTTKADFSLSNGLGRSSISTIAARSEHKKLKKGKFKGFIFGNLPRPMATE